MTVYQFENFALDDESFELSQDGAPLRTEPLVIDLLLEFLRNPGRLLTRDDLIAAVWDGRFVSDSTVSTAVKSARKILGDNGDAQRLIRTVRGRGFQFVPQVTTGRERQTETAPTPGARRRPCLHIHIGNLDDALSASEQRALGNRLRTTLNRMPLLRISAARTGDGDAPDPRRLLDDIGATHLAEITIAPSGTALEADVALIETQGGLQVWARTVRVEKVPGATEILLHQIVAHFEPAMMRAMIALYSQDREARSPEALVLEAVGTLATQGWNRKSFDIAGALLDQAIDGDNRIAMAHAYAALIRALSHRVGIDRNPEQLDAAISYAEAALDLETQDSFVLGITGCALCDAGQLERGLPILQRSAELDPNNGHALTALGAASIMRGEFEDAVEKLRAGIAISPADSRLALWEALLSMAELVCGRVGLALEAAHAATSRDDRNYLSRLALASVNAAMQDGPGLQAAIKELLRVHPSLTSDEVLYFCGQKLHAGMWPAIEAARAAQSA